MKTTSPKTPSVVGRNGLLADPKLYKFVKPGPNVARAKTHPFENVGDFGAIGGEMCRHKRYPKVRGVYIEMSPFTVVPAHRRDDSAKCITVLSGFLSIATYTTSWEAGRVFGDELMGEGFEFFVISLGKWHSIYTDKHPCTLLVTWKEYKAGGTKPAVWETHAENLVTGTGMFPK